MTDKISREQLDSFSANILINLGLINAAALAATISTISGDITSLPFAIGLGSSIISQIFWFGDSAFDHIFGEAEESVNLKIEFWTSLIILISGAFSASSIIYGCFCLIGFSGLLSVIGAVFICVLPLGLMVYKAKKESEFRQQKK